MLQRREIILTPGSVQVIRLALKPEVQALGLLVGYRAFDLAAWRVVFPLDGRVATRLRADVNRAGVQLHPLNRD
jgi:type VI secretion system VasD/TssJ family lipoprotein